MSPGTRAGVFGLMAISASLTLCVSCERSRTTASPASWRFGTSLHEVVVNGDGRNYLLHTPPARPRSRFRIHGAFPLVVMLHGSGAEGATIRLQSNFDSLADAQHFVVAYPDGSTGLFGIGSDWNAGDCCGAAARDSVDDIAFIRTVIADISTHLPIDSRRVYVAGFSDGGRMAYHFACAAAREVAAIGVVSGSLTDSHCAPSVPVPAIVVHGTADTEVPISEPALTPPPTPPARELLWLPPAQQFWAIENRCSLPQTRVIAATVSETKFRTCLGADLVLYTVADGTHSWPGGKRDGSDGAEPNRAMDASTIMMKFFLAHSR